MRKTSSIIPSRNQAAEQQRAAKSYLDKLDDDYYNTGTSVLEDVVYDELVREYEQEYGPRTKVRAKSRLTKQNQVKLPFTIGSLSKIQYGREEDKGKLRRFSSLCEGDYLVENKIDGISLVVIYWEHEVFLVLPTELTLGDNISYALDILKIPRRKNKKLGNYCIRGEATMTREHWLKNYPEDSKIRNTVSGLFHRRIAAALDGVIFETYEILTEEVQLSPEEQLEELLSMGFSVTAYSSVMSPEEESLKELYLQRKKDAPYDIDGLVLIRNVWNELSTLDRPKYAIAFKVNTEGIETTVKHVEWNVSKHRRFCPKVCIEEVLIDGARFNFASGKDARSIVNKGIGPGAIVKLIRSGDAIPDIIEVVKKVEPQLPPEGEYEWDDNGVYILALGEDYEADNEVMIIVNFINTVNILNVGEKLVAKLYSVGIRTILDFLSVDLDLLMTLDQVKEKAACRVRESIQLAMGKLLNNRGKYTIEGRAKLMSGSVCFGIGFGYKKSLLILQAMPQVLVRNYEEEEIYSSLIEVKGLGEKTISLFLQGLKEFRELYRGIRELGFEPLEEDESCEEDDRKETLKGEVIAGSGMRVRQGSELEKSIKKAGGDISTSVTLKVTILLVKDKKKDTLSVKKCRERGVEILTEEEFTHKYLR